MQIKLPIVIRNFFITNSFSQKNYIILRAFQPFYRIAIIAVFFTIMAAVLEAVGIGLIASLLQGLTNPNQPPLESGMRWFDIRFLGIETDYQERIWRISG